MQQERPWLTEQFAEACAELLKRQQECWNVLRDALVSFQVPRLVCHRHVLASRAERTEQTVKYR